MTDQRHIYTVSGLTGEIKTLLEDRFPFVWITGEISNLATPASGHSYFSLKDSHAVIRCVMFNGQKRTLKFTLESGMEIMGLARLGLYEPRGEYQLIFEHIAPEGAGALQKAFEQLKAKLSAEGLFDAAHKKPLPFLPRCISVITSGTGAAVRDIIHIARKRFPGFEMDIVPVAVQGDQATDEIVYAIETVNKRERNDLIILARGGGSIEDLAAFNTERVARAIFDSQIPVITGIGHETDVTIADFVADHRAPTPSGAAEAALPEKAHLIQRIDDLHAALTHGMTRQITTRQQTIDVLHRRLKSPAQVAGTFEQTLTSFFLRMKTALGHHLTFQKEKLTWLSSALHGVVPDTQPRRDGVEDLRRRLTHAVTACIVDPKARIRKAEAQLMAMNPTSVLKRGYSIARTLPERQVILDADTVAVQDVIEIILSKGHIQTRVEKKTV